MKKREKEDRYIDREREERELEGEKECKESKEVRKRSLVVL